jgi:hypothetical protein
MWVEKVVEKSRNNDVQNYWSRFTLLININTTDQIIHDHITKIISCSMLMTSTSVITVFSFTITALFITYPIYGLVGVVKVVESVVNFLFIGTELCLAARILHEVKLIVLRSLQLVRHLFHLSKKKHVSIDYSKIKTIVVTNSDFDIFNTKYCQFIDLIAIAETMEHTIIIPANDINNPNKNIKCPNLSTIIYLPETIKEDNKVSLIFKKTSNDDIYLSISTIRSRVTTTKNCVKNYILSRNISLDMHQYLYINSAENNSDECFQTIGKSPIRYSFNPDANNNMVLYASNTEFEEQKVGSHSKWIYGSKNVIEKIERT